MPLVDVPLPFLHPDTPHIKLLLSLLRASKPEAGGGFKKLSLRLDANPVARFFFLTRFSCRIFA